MTSIAPFAWLRSYQQGDLTPDLVAGAALWALVVPQSVAYAALADVPVEHGLYAMVPALLCYAAFGGSSRVVVGVSATTAALSPLVIASATDADAGELVAFSAAVSLAVGCIFLFLGIARMGWIANFLSAPVVSGFITGFGITLAIGQIPKMLGYSIEGKGALRDVWSILRNFDQASGATFVVGALSLAVLLSLRRLTPRVPGTLVVVILGIVGARLADLGGRGVSLVGEMPSGLPSFGLPDVGWSNFGVLLLASTTITIVGLSEAVGAAEAVAHRHGEDLDLDREFVANGIANLGSGLSSGIVVNASLSKTAANDSAGARTQLSSIVAAALGLVTLLLLTRVFADLPNAVLGAVVFQAAIGLIDLGALREAGRIQRTDLIAGLGALVGTLMSDILTGMILGVVLSLLLLIRNASRPSVRLLGRDVDTGRYQRLDRHPDSVLIDGIAVTRVDGPVFFASSAPLRAAFDRIIARDHPRFVVIDLEAVGYLDTTGLNTMREMRLDLERSGTEVHLAHVHDDVLDVLRRADADVLAPEAGRVHSSVDLAVAAIVERTGHGDSIFEGSTVVGLDE